MEKLICRICGQVFEYEKLSSCRAILTRHLKEKHQISPEEYQVKYYCNNIHPKCACGCGNDVKWNSKKWSWNKYVADSHVGKINSEFAAIVKENIQKSKKVVLDLKQYYQSKYDSNIAKSSLNDFMTKEYTLSDLSEKYKLDKRTLKRMWFELEMITPELYSEIISFLKYNLSSEKNKEVRLLNNSCYTWAYVLLKEHPQKYTISSLINEYNKNNCDKINTNCFVFYKQLKEMYGDEIDILLVKGYHSKEEYIFCDILKFFIPSIKMKIGFKITKDKYSPIYDICINNTHIIEYDSKGKFHKNEEEKLNDLNKEQKARDYGYKFLRLSYDDIHDINIIEKIKIWLNL
jgi:hypothetical protein